METRTYSIYKFAELSDESKEAAVQQYREDGFDYGWWDCVYEDAKEIALLMGIDIENIYFSGFSSQGDGACFEGDYSYKKNTANAVKEYAPKDTELHRIAQALQDIQKACFYSISASVKHSGHYNHRYCTEICVDFENHYNANDYFDEKNETAVIELLRDFMLWIYKQLEKEWNCQNSDEAIVESIKANDYDFTEDGKIA